MKKTYLSIITVAILSMTVQVQAWSWNQLNPVTYVPDINWQAWNPLNKEYKKPVMGYSEYCDRVLSYNPTPARYNPDTRLMYFKAERGFLNARKKFVAQTDNMKKREAYLDRKIYSLANIIARKDIAGLIAIEDNLWESARVHAEQEKVKKGLALVVDTQMNRTHDLVEYSGMLHGDTNTRLVAPVKQERIARSYKEDNQIDAYINKLKAVNSREVEKIKKKKLALAAKKAELQAQLDESVRVDEYLNKAAYANAQEEAKVEQAVLAAKKAELQGQLDKVVHVDEYLNKAAYANAQEEARVEKAALAAKKAKLQAQLDESVRVDEYLSKAAYANAQEAAKVEQAALLSAKKAELQAQLDESVRIDEYLNKAAYANAQEAAKNAELQAQFEAIKQSVNGEKKKNIGRIAVSAAGVLSAAKTCNPMRALRVFKSVWQ